MKDIQLTEREAALMGPRVLKDPRSKEYAYSTLHHIRRMYQDRLLTEQEWQKAIDEAREARIWEALGKPSLADLIEDELGAAVRAEVERGGEGR